MMLCKQVLWWQWEVKYPINKKKPPAELGTLNNLTRTSGRMGFVGAFLGAEV